MLQRGRKMKKNRKRGWWCGVGEKKQNDSISTSKKRMQTKSKVSIIVSTAKPLPPPTIAHPSRPVSFSYYCHPKKEGNPSEASLLM
jgi:hypothetical protein